MTCAIISRLSAIRLKINERGTAMRNKFFFMMIIFFIFICMSARAEVRTYRQVRDVAATENGNVVESSAKGNLFQYTYDIDTANNKVLRTKVMRLDESSAHNDATEYTITGVKHIIGSEAGNGGEVIVATQKGGNEILELGHRFAFTTRTSPFSQVITGVYKRTYDRNNDERMHRHEDKPDIR
jgi:hypothetical protein